MVIDEFQPFSPGRVACGLINPVTGMRIVKSWMIDELLPIASQTYKQLEKDLGISISNKLDIVEFHPTQPARETFNERAKQYPEYLHPEIDTTVLDTLFHFHYGAGTIQQGGLTDMRGLQDAWRTKLRETEAIREERFDWGHCNIQHDSVTYKDIEAEKIIFCDGAAGLENPYFTKLPFALNKGEVLIADIPGLPRNNIYKHGIKIAPWQDGLFWIGSSFEWTFTNLETSEAFRSKTENQLKNWLKLPYKIYNQWASVRPATVDHKPFSGFHPLYPSVGILNGMGAKGCSQAPYFANNLAQHLIAAEPLHREADIMRYKGILSR